MAFLQPDRYFSRLSHVSIQRDLLGCGFENALLDIDNTVVTRGVREVPRDIRLWLHQAASAGVGLCLLSNNWHADVHEFAAELGLPIVAKACKPLPPAYFVALHKLGARRASTVAIGDQLSTDVVGAHAIGMTAYLLQPLVNEDLRHTAAIRNIERAILGEREPEGASVAMRNAEGEAR